MRVLFVPIRICVVSHGISLLALDGMLEGHSMDTAFLLPRRYHKMMSELGANVLDIDYGGFRHELEAYGRFRPDVVVDDCSGDTGIATRLQMKPRITIHRTGMFPGSTP